MKLHLLKAAGAVAAVTIVAAGLPEAAFLHGGARHGGEPARPELLLPRSPAFDYDPPVPGSYALPPIRPAADGEVLDESGAGRRLRALLRHKATVMAFIYTRCGDICPKTMMVLHELGAIAREDEALGDALRLVAISFDPEHDTPEVMAMQAAAWREPGEGVEWQFLTTAGEATLRPLLDAYDQPVGRKADPLDPSGPLAHQLRVFLIDGESEIRNIYSLEFLDPRLVTIDVRTLVAESPLAGHHERKRQNRERPYQ